MKIKGDWFLDSDGRRLMLRGVNLSGASKVPYQPDGATYRRENFFDHRNVSFVGRPFPLDEADEHFSRLKHWGLHTLRFLVTWEAIEHAGPGIYDRDYLDYLAAVVEKAAQHGLKLFIDPHQDVWSRFSGGDGAPGWTLEAVGFDLKNLHPTGAAVVHALYGENYPQMIWWTNAYKLASATMFTLFFAGDTFAPKTQVEGQPVQGYLQSHYIAAIQQIARRLKGYAHVMGYDSMNEPSDGWIGVEDIRVLGSSQQLGDSPTPFQSMLLGDGIPMEVDHFKIKWLGIRKTGVVQLNPQGLRAWQENRECVWRENGVWDYDHDGRPRLLDPGYFACVDGRKVDFSNDFLRPFINSYGKAIRQEHPSTLIFIEGVPQKKMPDWTEADISDVVDAYHWYDGTTLITKRFLRHFTYDLETGKLVLGAKRVQALFKKQLAEIKKETKARIGDVPTVIGEFGIPFDMHQKKAYRTGNFHRQVLALDATFKAVEENLLHGTLWNYTPDNTNTHGDLWNDEDLSIFSRDQQENPDDINSGARAPEAFIRPYPIATAGEPRALSFQIKRAQFEFTYEGDVNIAAPTVIFVPEFHYGKGIQVFVSDGTYNHDPAAQQLLYYPENQARLHTIRICQP